MLVRQMPLFGDSASEIEVSDEIFSIKDIRYDLIKLYRDWQLAGRMKGTKAVKGLSEVSGSGKKPWKQKGTGRARAGSKRRPQDRGGAVAHDVATVHAFKLNKKVKELAIKSVLSHKMMDGGLVFVNECNLTNHKTSEMLDVLKKHDLHSSCLIVDSSINENIARACANLHNVNCLPAKAINVYSVLNHHNLVISSKALEEIVNRFEGKSITMSESPDA